VLAQFHQPQRVVSFCKVTTNSGEKDADSLRPDIVVWHTFLMFSAEVLDHFQNPRNSGELRNPSASVEVTNPVCGDVLRLAVRSKGGIIEDAKFLCRGCATAIACASLLTERLQNASVSDARLITAESLSTALGGLPAATFHGAQLASDAIAGVLKELGG
jgi:nitrogen fixation NifU-like protein